ncbi:type IV pilin [Natrialba taiwanensis]|uniref:type IV pilin n=1 Tax=Natrialba taiwanensis TaxID=160846 RepID=UPI0009FD4A3A|nr:type IV pilin N-terminal domain-containing protein [Natrialba taiwanensis]
MDLTKYRAKLIGNEEERAVSPVIGVILMVAITVILAAVIAAFVLDMGDSIGDSTPNGQIGYESNAAWDGSSGGVEVLGTFNHEGGDEVEADEVEVQLESDSGEVTLDANNGFSSGDVEMPNFDTGDTFTVGDSLDIEALDGSEISSGDDYEITIIHNPTDTILNSEEGTAP